MCLNQVYGAGVEEQHANRAGQEVKTITHLTGNTNLAGQGEGLQ